MGHDIVILANHQLNTSHVQSLAQDLATRLNASIDYGYQDAHSGYRDIATVPTYAYCSLGEIQQPGSKLHYVLQDHQYQLKQFHRELGEQFFELPQIKQANHIIANFKRAVFCEQYSLHDAASHKEVANIFTDYLDCQLLYYSRWWHFCGHFTSANDVDPGFIQLNQFRQDLQSLLQQLGGTEMVLLDDQGATGYLTCDHYLWQEILDELNARFKESTCTIPAFLQAGIPRKAGDYPLAFYDDFSDMRMR